MLSATLQAHEPHLKRTRSDRKLFRFAEVYVACMSVLT